MRDTVAGATSAQRFAYGARAVARAQPVHWLRILAAASLLALVNAPVRASEIVEIKRIALPDVQGRIDHLAFDPSTHRIYVAALGNHTVEVVDLQRGRLVETLEGFAGPQGVLVLPEHARLLVTDGERGELNLIDTQSLRRFQRLSLPEDADNVRYDLAAGRIYIGAGTGSAGALEMIDATRFTRLGSISLPAHPESFQIEQSGQRIFVNVPDAGAVAVIVKGARRPQALWSIPARSNFPMALDESHHRLFIGARRPASLIVLDTDDGHVIATQHTVGDADDVYYDAAHRRVFVSGGEGYVEVFRQLDPDRYERVERIRTRRGARTSLFLTAEQRLLVAVPNEGAAPAELRVFSTNVTGKSTTGATNE